jgi:hypothetical protein
MVPAIRTAQEWFAEAGRCYIEGHQACAWCGSAHQVFKTETATGVEYRCGKCDFHAGYDHDLDRYLFVPGEEQTRTGGVVTLHDL